MRWRALALLLTPLFFGGAAARAVQIMEFPLPSPASAPAGITVGPDGAIWFAEREASRIGRITTGGVLMEYPLAPGRQPNAIVAGPDGALWFTEADRVGRITTAGAVSEFAVGASGAVMLDITAGADGNLWYSYELLVPGPGPLGRFGRMTTSGSVAEFDPPFPARVMTSLAATPDGNIWFAGTGLASFSGGPQFGVVGRFASASDYDAASLGAAIPQRIAIGRDGKVWFTVQVPVSFGTVPAVPPIIGKLGRVDPAALGVSSSVTEFAIPARESAPYAITAGPDGNVWFTDRSETPRIGRATPQGAVTEVSAPGATGSIVAGPDGALWFTEPDAGRIGRLSRIDALCAPTATSLCMDDGRFRVETSWTSPDGTTGAAHAVPQGSSGNTGYFWFFTEDTPEVTVKTIRGCAFNGDEWFFAGGLTNLAVTLRVTDLETAQTKTYSTPAGPPFTPVHDTAAFPCSASPAGRKPAR
jgi:virginiamycin B lyase